MGEAKETDKKMGKRRYKVDVDEALCDGCGVCLFYCKPTVFEITSKLNRRGISPAIVIDEPGCTNCGLCVIACPQIAIAVAEIAATAPEGPNVEGGEP